MKLDLIPAGPDTVSEKCFLIKDQETFVGKVGFTRDSLLSDSIYVAFVPDAKLNSLNVLRAMKRLFDTVEGWYFYCQVDPMDSCALNFAHFFGFTFVNDVGSRILLGKDTR